MYKCRQIIAMVNPIDRDYIDVEKKRADISTTDESGNFERGSRADQNADRSHLFHATDGDGSASNLDELIDQNAIIENDGRGDTRTFFYPSEAAEGQQQQYYNLRKWQSGMWRKDKSRDTENNEADMRRWISMFASRLELTDYQHDRVLLICEGLNMSHMANYSTEKVIVGVISLVANEDDRMIRDESEFRQLLTTVSSDLKELRSIRELIKRKSDRL